MAAFFVPRYYFLLKKRPFQSKFAVYQARWRLRACPYHQPPAVPCPFREIHERFLTILIPELDPGHRPALAISPAPNLALLDIVLSFRLIVRVVDPINVQHLDIRSIK